jgi:DNA replication and repair protein RecF
LDFLGAQVVPDYLRKLRAYERALRSRNALLKNNRPRREIAAFDGPLIESGLTLLASRADLCETLRPLVTAACRQISGRNETLEITYRRGSGPDFAAALEETRDEEIRLRTTVAGPHRDDLEITLEARKAATFASEGQQRTIALALKLGQARALENEAGRPPLYLIDDVFGELDSLRRNNLLAALPADGQKLITTTTIDWLETPQDAVRHELGSS